MSESQTEYPYRIPTDGSLIAVTPPFQGGTARSAEILNGTNQTLLVVDDQGYYYQVPGGKVVVIGLLRSTQWRLQLAAPATNNNPMAFAIFYRNRRPTSGDFYVGDAAAMQNVNLAEFAGHGAGVEADNMAGITTFAIMTTPAIFNGGSWDRYRTPNIWKTAVASAAGNTALWTPSAGLRFRLMKYRIEVLSSSVMAVAGIETIQLQDGANVLPHSAYPWIPAAAANTPGVIYNSGLIDIGNGQASSAINSVLNINLSTALVAGGVRVWAFGTEEL